MSDIYINAAIDSDALARDLVNNHHEEEVMAFIVKVDELVADYQFTERLRDKLTAALDEEDMMTRPEGADQ